MKMLSATSVLNYLYTEVNEEVERYITACDLWQPYVIEQSDISSIVGPRNKFSHKANYGHALLLAGAYTRAGAAILSAGAAMRSGVGLLTVSVCPENVPVLQISVPEAMLILGDAYTTIIHKYNAIGIGPAWGIDAQRASELENVFKISNALSIPIVVDADAISILAAQPKLLNLLPKHAILTPHEGELKRLVGQWDNKIDKLERQMAFSQKYNVYVVGKGAFTATTFPENEIKNKIVFNTTGNPGMATAGSGDVLTGIIMALLAKGLPAGEAAVTGVYLHGLAADLAVEEKGEEGLIARDIIKYLPKAFKKISEANK